ELGRRYALGADGLPGLDLLLVPLADGARVGIHHHGELDHRIARRQHRVSASLPELLAHLDVVELRLYQLLRKLLRAFLPQDLLDERMVRAQLLRSEERRVGKECRSRWARDELKKKKIRC